MEIFLISLSLCLELDENDNRRDLSTINKNSPRRSRVRRTQFLSENIRSLETESSKEDRNSRTCESTSMPENRNSPMKVTEFSTEQYDVNKS